MALPCRFIEPVGWRLRIIALWDGECVNGWGGHSGRVVVEETINPAAQPETSGSLEKYQDDPRWAAMVCDRCGAKAPEDMKRAAGCRRFYDTSSGKPEPGDMYWVPCTAATTEWGCFHWDNCDGNHLHVITPSGEEWDIDGQASNCTMKDDRTHRCWVRTGDPPNVTAGKNGHTCSAGAGSIAVPGYHGFLRGGSFT
jgi:hypothetical protein